MKILVISPTPTHPPVAGNRARIKMLVSALRSLGHEVYFVFVPMESGDLEAMNAFFDGKFARLPYRAPRAVTGFTGRCIRRIRRFARDERAYLWKVDDWYDERLSDTVRLLDEEHRFDAVLVEYVFLSRALEVFSDSVLKLIDTHDRFSNRHREYLAAGKRPEWFSTTPEGECHGLARANVVIAIQEKEADFFRACLTERVRIVTVGHLLSVSEHVSPPGSTSAVFVGSSNSINVEGINYFIQRVLPLIRAQRGEFSVMVAGDVCNDSASAEGVKKLGRVASLSEVYRLGALAINPVRMGTGLNIKTIECLALGVPLVVTESGSRGLEALRQKAFIAVRDDDPQQMAGTILDLLASPARRLELASEGLHAVRELNAIQTRELATVLTDKRSRALRVASCPQASGAEVIPGAQ